MGWGWGTSSLLQSFVKSLGYQPSVATRGWQTMRLETHKHTAEDLKTGQWECDEYADANINADRESEKGTTDALQCK